MSHRDGPCSRSAVVACCVAIGMLQRHVGVGSDRSPAALPLPLRLSVGGARRESHSDTLPISRACEWSHSQAAMCRNECERDGKRQDWQNKKNGNRVPAFKGYAITMICAVIILFPLTCACIRYRLNPMLQTGSFRRIGRHNAISQSSPFSWRCCLLRCLNRTHDQP